MHSRGELLDLFSPTGRDKAEFAEFRLVIPRTTYELISRVSRILRGNILAEYPGRGARGDGEIKSNIHRRNYGRGICAPRLDGVGEEGGKGGSGMKQSPIGLVTVKVKEFRNRSGVE